MGMMDWLRLRLSPRVAASGYWKTLNGYTPVFTSWGGNLYESELVRSAIDARARHCSKLQVVITGTAQPSLRARMKHRPNPIQTWGQFLYKTCTILDMQNTVFLVPIVDEFGRKCGVYSLLPSSCELVDVGGEPWLRYTFRNGDRAAERLTECGILTKFQYDDDLFGSSNRALDSTMQLINIQRQGIMEGVKNSNTFRFMARLGNFASAKDLEAEQKRFSANNLSGDGNGGMLLFPNTYQDIKQLDYKNYTIDPEQVKQIQTNVYNYFGVNEAILQNAAFGDAWSAFYEGAIEPFSVQLSDVLTAMFFTEREQETTKFFATSNRLQYMSNKDKLEFAKDMADRGLAYRNELREIFNLPPLPDGVGNTLPARGEYYNVGDENNEGDDADAGEE